MYDPTSIIPNDDEEKAIEVLYPIFKDRMRKHLAPPCHLAFLEEKVRDDFFKYLIVIVATEHRSVDTTQAQFESRLIMALKSVDIGMFLKQVNETRLCRYDGDGGFIEPASTWSSEWEATSEDLKMMNKAIAQRDHMARGLDKKMKEKAEKKQNAKKNVKKTTAKKNVKKTTKK
jgi:hypothetical protein